ncbi:MULTISPECIES: autotransporter outer membrane beta-barrel domain-containing protein [Pseudomonas]|uniref:autotransporter family protein n=1 Tax=Pseudomonas TaxID=286 RepID=UPI001070B767|nr:MULTISPECIES: autotransporter outer membrane beta-barrel domain-containing protein [Pseudomonas]QBR30120.1 autotransporter domain-containing protein [Pseudomonas sp. S150]UZT93613.1 autotransporter outer membrane beta-barrel domain-containing protein [Pseudomonas koreensis]
MTIVCLRRSVLALSISAAAALHTTMAIAAGASLNHDLSGGPLTSNLQNWGLITLSGNGNIAPVSQVSTTYGAQLSGVTADQLRNTGNIRIDGARFGTGISLGTAGVVPTKIAGALLNEGSISVHGLADAGTSSGISDLGSTLGDSLVNSGSIDVSGQTASGLLLVHTNMTGLSNRGTITASGTDALGVLLDGATLSQSVNNTGTIRATGANAEAVVFEGVKFSAPASANSTALWNGGTISGEDIGVHVSGQASGARPFGIYQMNGLIEGGKAAIQVDDGASYFYFYGGAVKGDLLGLSGVLVDGDATFDGSTIRSGYVTIEEGTLTLMKPHTTFIGDFDMEESNSVLEMYLGNDTNPALPVLKVTGTTDIAPGAQLRLLARSSDFRVSPGGTRYTLISSGNLVGGNNLTVTSTSALLDVKSFGVVGNDITSVVTTKSSEVLAENTLAVGGSDNAATAVGHVPGLLARLDEQDPVFQAFANAGTDAELARLSETLSPDVSRGVLHAATNSQTLVSGVINDRSSRARSATGAPEKGVWLQALSSDANQDERRGVAGYDADSHGIAVGADGQLNADTTLGLAYSYLDTDVKSDLGNKTKVTGHALTLYSNWVHDNWFVDSSLMYGWNDNESKRYIAGTQAKADYDSDVFGVSALAGYSLRLMPDLVLEPQVGARYANVGMDAYREKGSSASLNVGSQRYEVGEMGVGARLAAAFDVGSGSLEPEAKLMAWHDFIGDKVSTTSAFVLGGESSVSRGTTPVRDSYELGLGANYRMGAWSVGGSYNYLTSSGFDSDSFTAKVRYAF